MNEHRDDEARLDELVADLASDYNEPPGDLLPEQREALFARIQAERQRRAVRHVRRRPRWGTWVAAAAMLVVGIGIGRLLLPTVEPSTPLQPTQATISEPLQARSEPNREALYRFAARDYLQRTETLLTEMRLAAYAPQPEMQIGFGTSTVEWANELLQETRLLLDSPAAGDVRMEKLLRDLELVLAEIVQATASADSTETESVRESLQDGSVLLRLRNEMPAMAGDRDV